MSYVANATVYVFKWMDDMDDTEPRQYNSSTVSNAAVRNTQPQIASGVT